MTRPNAVTTSYSYDAVSNLLSVLHKNSGGAVLDGAEYTYGAAGDRASKMNKLNSVSSSYSYDPVYQLLSTMQSGNTVESFTYDLAGNRLSSLDVPVYAYNESNQMNSAGATSFTYDDNGNTLTKTDAGGTTQYAWDFDDRLISVTPPGASALNFTYDPFGRRIRKGTAIYVYDGADLIQESDSAGNLVARYVFAGIDQPLVAYRGTATEFYQADGLGSTTSLSSKTGALDATFQYGSYGNLISSTGSFAQPFRYTGREFDTETGLYYYRARYYDPNTGRFISEDPIRSGMNFYAYVHNDPVNFVDPFGLQDNASPWQVGWEWLTGRGPRTHNFTDGDPFTEMLRHHEHIQDLINDVCNGTLPQNGRFDYQLGGFGGVPKYLRDYSTLFSGGLTGNLAVTYLGSYGLSYSVTNGTLNINVWNTSSIASATHPPVIGYTNWWNNNIGDPLNSFFSSGPMSPTTQNFSFHENLAGRGCGCKQ